MFVSGTYVRNMHDGKTCVEAGYKDITSRFECKSAFHSHPGQPEVKLDQSDEIYYYPDDYVRWRHCSSFVFSFIYGWFFQSRFVFGVVEL